MGNTSDLNIVYQSRTINVTECSFAHYENALAKWRFSRTLWGRLWCLIFGTECVQIEFTQGMDHTCIDLTDCIAIQVRSN
jgi:hypothetical protein